MRVDEGQSSEFNVNAWSITVVLFLRNGNIYRLGNRAMDKATLLTHAAIQDLVSLERGMEHTRRFNTSLE